jgi:hypothetical protein
MGGNCFILWDLRALYAHFLVSVFYIVVSLWRETLLSSNSVISVAANVCNVFEVAKLFAAKQ